MILETALHMLIRDGYDSINIKNVAKENKADARTLMRIYMMERFLERVANSQYKDNFIIKVDTNSKKIDVKNSMDILLNS